MRPLRLAVLLGLVLGHRGVSTGHVLAPSSLTSTVASLDGGELDDVTPSYTLSPLVVTGTVSRAHVAPSHAPVALTWACGPVELNAVGGSQRSCEWVRP